MIKGRDRKSVIRNEILAAVRSFSRGRTFDLRARGRDFDEVLAAEDDAIRSILGDAADTFHRLLMDDASVGRYAALDDEGGSAILRSDLFVLPMVGEAGEIAAFLAMDDAETRLGSVVREASYIGPGEGIMIAPVPVDDATLAAMGPERLVRLSTAMTDAFATVISGRPNDDPCELVHEILEETSDSRSDGAVRIADMHVVSAALVGVRLSRVSLASDPLSNPVVPEGVLKAASERWAATSRRHLPESILFCPPSGWITARAHVSATKARIAIGMRMGLAGLGVTTPDSISMSTTARGVHVWGHHEGYAYGPIDLSRRCVDLDPETFVRELGSGGVVPIEREVHAPFGGRPN